VSANSKPQADAAGLIAQLTADFPGAFSDPPRPLRLGIRQDLQFESKLTDEEIDRAMTKWTQRTSYLRTQTVGAIRYDLRGRPCGTVSEENAYFASQRLAQMQYEKFRATLIGDLRG